MPAENISLIMRSIFNLLDVTVIPEDVWKFHLKKCQINELKLRKNCKTVGLAEANSKTVSVEKDKVMNGHPNQIIYLLGINLTLNAAMAKTLIARVDIDSINPICTSELREP